METLEKANTEVIAKDLDMADELRDAADVHMTSYQQRMTNLYNRHVKPRAFQAGDMVLRRVFENMADLSISTFFKGIINKVSFKAFSSNSRNIINKFFFKGIINKISFKVFSFNSWNSPHIKDQMWHLVCWHFQKTRCDS